MDSIYESLPRTFNCAAFFIEEKNLRCGRENAAVYLYQDKTFTYGQIHSYVRRMATMLGKLNVEWENRVALLLPDRPELAISFWGCIWGGAVPVPINTAYRLDDISYIIEDCRAKVLVTTSQWRNRLPPHISPFLQHIVIIDEAPTLFTVLNDITQETEAAMTTKDDVAFWLYTSGSTGRPKGVIHLHHDMVACAQLYARDTIGLQQNDVIYSVAKIPFAYGLGNTLYMPMEVGAAAILSDATNAFGIIADIHRYRPTVFFAIPSIYAALLNVENLTSLDASSLRMCISAAEQLPPSLWYRWRDQFNLEICEGIGTTELLHIFLSNLPGQCKPGSTGKPLPGYTVRVVDEEGNPAAPGVPGNLEVGGESLMLGYWNRHQETCKAIFGNCMKTGDTYLVDAEGYFYFTGRADDRFRVNGQWILPVEIEDVLLQYPGVYDVAVVPDVNKQDDLTQVAAYIVLKTDVEITPTLEQNLKKHVKRKLLHYKVPRQIFFVDAIERTATGKIDRKRLRRQTASKGRNP
jgi:benzoate-CoA ligase family protein